MLTGTSVEEVAAALADHEVDAVVMGAGVDLEPRHEIVRHVFEVSETTTVHMTDRGSGPRWESIWPPLGRGVARSTAR